MTTTQIFLSVAYLDGLMWVSEYLPIFDRLFLVLLIYHSELIILNVHVHRTCDVKRCFLINLEQNKNHYLKR